MDLKAALTNHIKKTAFQEQLLRAVVVSVDKPKRLCVVKLDNGTEIEDILIQPISGYNKGLVIFPKIGSKVLLEKIEAQDMALKIASYTEIDELGLIVNKLKLKIDPQGNIDIEVGDTKMKIVDGEVSFEIESTSLKYDGSSINIESPKINVDGDEIVFNGGQNLGLVKIAPLLAKLNALELMMNTHTHLIVLPVPSTPTSPSPIQLPVTTLPEIMNPDIKH